MRRLFKNTRDLVSVTAPRIAAWMKKQGVFSTGGNFPNIAPLLAGMMKEAMYHGIMDMRKQIEELQNVRTRKLGEGVTGRAWLSVIPEDALNWIDTYTPELVRVLEQSLLDKCRDSIAKGMRDGSTNEGVMKELSKTFDDFSRHRLEAIARTESMRGYNLGGLVGLKTTRGAVGVEFLAIMDERVTPECEARNGMRLRIDDPHLINNTPPLHPQCRSVLIPLLDDEVDERWTGDSELAAELEVDVPTTQRKSDIEAVRKVWSKEAADWIMEKESKKEPQSMPMKLDYIPNKENKAWAEEVLQGSPSEIRTIFSQLQPPPTYREIKGTSNADVFGNGIEIGFEARRTKERYQHVFFHEMGHLVDARNRIKGESAYHLSKAKNAPISKGIEADKKLFTGKMTSVRLAKKQEILNAVAPTSKWFKDAEVSDIICCMTGGKISGYYGHSASYLRRTGYGNAEVFANLFALKAQNKTEAFEFVRTLFPQTVKAFENALPVLKGDKT